MLKNTHLAIFHFLSIGQIKTQVTTVNNSNLGILKMSGEFFIFSSMVVKHKSVSKTIKLACTSNFANC